MFYKNWTKKEWGRAALCFVIYFVLVLAVEFLGFLSPLMWVLTPILAAFLGAGPLTCVMDMGRGLGGAAVIPLLYFILMKLMGEFGMPLMIVGMFCVMILAEVVRYAAGYEKRSSIRAATPVLALLTFASFLPLYFQTAAYGAAAVEEMGQEYGEKIVNYGNFGMLLLVAVLCIAAGILSERLTEKILKLDDPEKVTFLHN